MASNINIVLYPFPAVGHLIATVELGKFIIHHHPSTSITVLLSPPSFNTSSTTDYVRHISATVPSIAFHHLPAVSLDLDPFPSREAVTFEVLHRSNPDVHRALLSLSPVSAFIIDFFCSEALSIASDLHIPTYYFLTSGAHILAFLLHFPFLHKNTTKSFKDMKNTLLHVPGVPPLPASDMIRPMLLDRTSSDYDLFLKFSLDLPNSAGLIVNTFESLEPRPLQAMREGKCNAGGHMPPVFCVGPLLNTVNGGGGGDKCLKWLDKQPEKSVVYICFGSLGLLSAAQLREVAVGLERSGWRFLWVVRSLPSEDKSNRFLRPPEPDLDVLLPEGFVERNKEKGLVVKSWAPQVAVLNHAAVGGFVTHCGWNSILEAVCAGVPMAAWPMYAEQHFNRVVMVEEMKVAVRVEEGEEGFVAAEEVERRVVELMSEKGREVRKAVEEKSVEARAAVAEGGSSVAALTEMVELWKSSRVI